MIFFWFLRIGIPSQRTRDTTKIITTISG
uniref:Uncharacterized protein n=1 Tax=Rhizophora mucronata TaxID=61149 RepID=A0A2P2PW28_RHIMU